MVELRLVPTSGEQRCPTGHVMVASLPLGCEALLLVLVGLTIDRGLVGSADGGLIRDVCHMEMIRAPRSHRFPAMIRTTQMPTLACRGVLGGDGGFGLVLLGEHGVHVVVRVSALGGGEWVLAGHLSQKSFGLFLVGEMARDQRGLFHHVTAIV